jgi:hypothetical protein
LTRAVGIHRGGRKVSSVNGAGKLDLHVHENEIGLLLYTITKINTD